MALHWPTESEDESEHQGVVSFLVGGFRPAKEISWDFAEDLS